MRSLFRWVIRIRLWTRLILFLFIAVVSTVLLNFTLYNPAISIPAFAWLEDHHVTDTYTWLKNVFHFRDGVLYPPVNASAFAKNSFMEARVSVMGTVGEDVGTADGDNQFTIVDAQGNTFIATILKEHPLPLPQKNALVRIWGITHYDLRYRSWGLMPVLGWEQIGSN